jgi:LemA protein
MQNRGCLVALAVLVVVLLAPIIGCIGSYNHIVRENEAVNSAWKEVENQLQRRFDLIPNYVETVKGFARQEQAIFLGVADARSKVGQTLVANASIADKIAANNQLSSALARLVAVAERYPELKSNSNFQALADELAGTENRIAVARKRYNDQVQIYNTLIRVLPGNVVAAMFHFDKAAYYEAPADTKAGMQKPPAVKF